MSMVRADNLLAVFKTGVFPNAHDGRERHGSLIQGLQEVRQDHDNQDTLVNHPAQAFARLLIDLDHILTRILRNLLVNTRVVDMVLVHALAVGRDPLDVGGILDVLGHRR